MLTDIKKFQDSHLTLSFRDAINKEWKHIYETIIHHANNKEVMPLFIFNEEEIEKMFNVGSKTFRDLSSDYILDNIQIFDDRYKIWNEKDMNNGKFNEYIESSSQFITIRTTSRNGRMTISTRLDVRQLRKNTKFQKILNSYIYNYNSYLHERYILLREFVRGEISIKRKQFIKLISKKLSENIIMYIINFIGNWNEIDYYFAYLDTFLMN